MSSTCRLGLESMASPGIHRRNNSSKSGKGGDKERDRNEPGVLEGLLPCVCGLAGISLLSWALFYFIILPETLTGKQICIKLDNPISFAEDLKTISDWQLFAVELGVSSDEISEGNHIEQILKLWSTRAGVPCLEKLVKTLEKLGEEHLISRITANYGVKYREDN